MTGLKKFDLCDSVMYNNTNSTSSGDFSILSD